MQAFRSTGVVVSRPWRRKGDPKATQGLQRASKVSPRHAQESRKPLPRAPKVSQGTFEGPLRDLPGPSRDPRGTSPDPPGSLWGSPWQAQGARSSRKGPHGAQGTQNQRKRNQNAIKWSKPIAVQPDDAPAYLARLGSTERSFRRAGRRWRPAREPAAAGSPPDREPNGTGGGGWLARRTPPVAAGS